MRASKHWLHQRISAIALLIFIPGVWWLSKLFITESYVELHQKMVNPIVLLIITLAFMFLIYHTRLGLEVIIEDYTRHTKRKILLVALNIMLLGILTIFFAAITLLLKGY